MKQKLWTLAFVSTRLAFFRGGMEGEGTQAPGAGFHRVNHVVTPQPPTGGSLEGFAGDSVEEPDFHRTTKEPAHSGPPGFVQNVLLEHASSRDVNEEGQVSRPDITKGSPWGSWAPPLFEGSYKLVESEHL